MLTDIVRSKIVKATDYELCFDDGRGNGFGFPCDKDGKLFELTPEAEANLAWCRKHPEKFTRFNKVIGYERSYREPGNGTCDCGNRVELWDQYLGACECPQCGRWYNLFGQELLAPEFWEPDPSDD